jgi:hypothetical protein
MVPEGAIGSDLVMLSAVAPLSLSPKFNILPGLVLGGQQLSLLCLHRDTWMMVSGCQMVIVCIMWH